MRQHRGKLPPYLRTSIISKPKTSEPSLPVKAPSFEEFFKQHVSQMPAKSNLSEEQIRFKFMGSLADVGAEYGSLELKPTEEPEFIEVFIDEPRNITLRYSPLLLRTITEEQIDALLLHEACHAITLPDTLLRVPDTQNEMTTFIADCMTNYHEYLAHVEFVRKFRHDIRYDNLKQQHISLFRNFEIIVNSTKVMLNLGGTKGPRINQFRVLQQLHSIAYDALFFHVAKDESFSKWCKEHGLHGLDIFISWLYEDFEYIRSLDLNLEKTDEKVMTSGVLSMSINPIKLIVSGEIEFADTTKKLHEDMIERGQDIDLVKLWERRHMSSVKGAGRVRRKG